MERANRDAIATAREQLEGAARFATCRSVVMLSVKPGWARALLARTKTVELRKAFRADLVGREMFLYASSPVQAVLGVVRIARLVTGSPDEVWRASGPYTGIGRRAYRAYFGTRSQAVGITVEAPVSFTLMAAATIGVLREVEPGFWPPMSYAERSADDPLVRLLLERARAACDDR